MTAQELVPWFQMASTILTGVGIIVSVSLGIASLNNNKRERIYKIRPDLLFNVGGQLMSASILPFQTLPGRAPNDPEVQSHIKALPADAKCLVLRDSFGQLFNLGQGAAFQVGIWFEPQRITVGDRDRWLTKSEQAAVPYTKAWNSITANPANLFPEASASFRILPGAVYAAAPEVSAISGRMRIECRDSQGSVAQWIQDTTFFIERISPTEATVTVSFEPRST